MKDCNFILCRHKSDTVDISVNAQVVNGCLNVSGQDIGGAAMEVFGDYDHEYFYDFDRENTQKLFELLAEDALAAQELFQKKFGGPQGCAALREFCERHGVAYKSFSC